MGNVGEILVGENCLLLSSSLVRFVVTLSCCKCCVDESVISDRSSQERLQDFAPLPPEAKKI